MPEISGTISCPAGSISVTCKWLQLQNLGAAAAASQNLGTTIAGFTGSGLQLGSTHNLGAAAAVSSPPPSVAAAASNLHGVTMMGTPGGFQSGSAGLQNLYILDGANGAGVPPPALAEYYDAGALNLGTTIGGFTGTGLQLGSTHNLVDWGKVAGYAEKGITVGAKTWCEVHGC